MSTNKSGYTRTTNPYTGNTRLIGVGRLMSISDTAVPNKNGNLVRICGLEIKTKSGELKVVRAIMPENNYKRGLESKDGLKEGDYLQHTVEQTPGYSTPLIVVSHLKSGATASNEDFDWDNGDYLPPSDLQVEAANKARAQRGLDPIEVPSGVQIRQHHAVRTEN